MLPPLPDDVEGRYAQVAQRVDREMAATEPTLDDTKKLMQADLFHTEMVTPEELALRHSRSIGKAFADLHRARQCRRRAAAARQPAVPLWQRMLDLKIPLLLIFGRNDRAHAGDRAELFKKMHPELNLHIVENCKHMVPWDAEQEVYRLAHPLHQGKRLKEQIMAKIRHLAFFSDSPEKMAQFYVNAFGFEIKGRGKKSVWITDGYLDIALLWRADDTHYHSGLNHFGITLEADEKEAVYQRLDEMGPHGDKAAGRSLLCRGLLQGRRRQ